MYHDMLMSFGVSWHFFMVHEVIQAIPPPPSTPEFSSAQRVVSPYVQLSDSPNFSAPLFPPVASFPPASFLNEHLRASEQLLAPSCHDTICPKPVCSVLQATGEGLLLAGLFLLGHSPFILYCFPFIVFVSGQCC